jgi:hypothetical protein
MLDILFREGRISQQVKQVLAKALWNYFSILLAEHRLASEGTGEEST